MKHFAESELLPAYGAAEAARYVRVSPDRVKRWTEALRLPGEAVFPLSFADLLQLHQLKAMRVEHGMPLQRVRQALPELRKKFGPQFPLLQQTLLTDGVNLFLQNDDDYVNLSRADQHNIREHFKLYLRRIDTAGKVGKLYPFVLPARVDAPTSIVIRPDIGFGQPTIDGTGIYTRVIASRFYGGDSTADLMEEYGVTLEQMDEVLRWERQFRADAA